MYAAEQDANHDDINQKRYNLLGQQMSIYKKDQISWSIWLYKDIGFQGRSNFFCQRHYVTGLDWIRY